MKRHDHPFFLSMEDVDDGEPFELVKIGDAHVDHRSRIRKCAGADLHWPLASPPPEELAGPPGAFAMWTSAGTIRYVRTYQ